MQIFYIFGTKISQNLEIFQNFAQISEIFPLKYIFSIRTATKSQTGSCDLILPQWRALFLIFRAHFWLSPAQNGPHFAAGNWDFLGFLCLQVLFLLLFALIFVFCCCFCVKFIYIGKYFLVYEVYFIISVNIFTIEVYFLTNKMVSNRSSVVFSSCGGHILAKVSQIWPQVREKRDRNREIGWKMGIFQVCFCVFRAISAAFSPKMSQKTAKTAEICHT